MTWLVSLTSFSCGLSGTNLTQASHIVMLDPVGGTNDEAKAVESQVRTLRQRWLCSCSLRRNVCPDQAIGRAHRQGQTKKLVVARFIVKDTLEYDILKQVTNLSGCALFVR